MDHFKTPISLIYKHRDSLKDFGVHTPGTVNNYLFSKLNDLPLMHVEGARDIALCCFNNAYYICTLIQIDEDPELLIADYENMLLKQKIGYKEDICAVSMAMVCKILPLCDTKWERANSILINNIICRFEHFHWSNSSSRTLFSIILNTWSTEGFTLPHEEFNPLDIIEVINNVEINDIAKGAEYICERLSLLDDPHKQTYGADLAIARLNDELCEIYNEWGYDPKTKQFDIDEHNSFVYEPNDKKVFYDSVNYKEWAIEYIKNHYPKPKKLKEEKDSDKVITSDYNSEKEMSSEIKELKNQQAQNIAIIKKLEEEKKKIEEELDFLKQPFEELTAVQKVRMKLAFRLLEAAGLTDDVLKKQSNKQKTAQIMSVLLDIHSNNARGNGAQTCATFISAKETLSERHLQIIEKLNNLLNELNINVQL